MKTPDLSAIRDWCKSRFQPIGSYASQSEIPTKTSELINDSGYLTNVPMATELSAGMVRVDGSTITIDSDGTIHAVSGGGTSGALDVYADQTVAMPFMLVNKDNVVEEETTWNQES